MAYRLDRPEAIGGSHELPLSLIGTVELEEGATDDDSSVPYFFSVFLAVSQ